MDVWKNFVLEKKTKHKEFVCFSEIDRLWANDRGLLFVYVLYKCQAYYSFLFTVFKILKDTSAIRGGSTFSARRNPIRNVYIV